jgi:hypothetical protein
VIAASSSRALPDLREHGVPQPVATFVEKCAANGEPLVAVLEHGKWDCIYPAFPEPSDVFIVAKEAGEKTVVTLRKTERGIRIVAIE